ncbi:hypothetical protein JM946_17310 [Steroidobacter sp. S1-65]|uniref:MotA/TolQ/ExbB proton channel domain-containing protein n=1 Tax=Steroidobacter gossypii TaxID=2805490 RepID=A0ABS1WZT1_9GAMM|nr:hypothetical protein [Steroidobacter gossypii]MBM0106490.1 hypothetical protein [Steroidobacter gossypii]
MSAAGQTRRIGLVLLLVIAGAGAWVGAVSPAIALKDFTGADVLRLLGAYAILALVLERTLEVLISAWRGEVKQKLFSEAQNAKLALRARPGNLAIEHVMVSSMDALQAYQNQTRAIALRAGVVGGLLIAAVGLRTLETFVTAPMSVPALWLFKALDLLFTAGMIGGGSEAVHKLMSTVTTYFEAVTGKLKDQNTSSHQGITVLTPPPLTPGKP